MFFVVRFGVAAVAPAPRAALALPRPPLALWAAGGLGRARALRWGPPGVFRRLRAAVPPPTTKSQGQDKRACGAALTFVVSGGDGKQGESP